MKHLFFKSATALLALSAFASCSEEAAMDDVMNHDDVIQSVSITGSDFELESGARSMVQIDETGVNFLWAENDTVGIFPNKGSQAEFAMSEGSGTQTATFSGGGWALKSSATYGAYYPYDFYNRDLTAIPVSYESQAQTGNASTAHLGAYDFMAASLTTPSNGAVAFDMQHMGALVMIQTDLDEAKTLTNVALKASTSAFTTTGTIDLTAVNPEITAKSTTPTLNIALNDFTIASNATATIYFMLAPTNLLGETLEITLSDEKRAYMKFKAAGKNFVAGTAYAYTLTNGEKPSIPYNAVDLGLPSGTLWADRNVGADSPEAYGDYFAWGETKPKSQYDWSTYKWCNGSDETLTKYCTSSDYGTVDGKTVLDFEDDAAYVNMGPEWRMPTLAEMEELMNNCTMTCTNQNGVEGYKVTGSNGNSIFLPAAGYCDNSDLCHAGSYGDYWLSSLDEGHPNFARQLSFYSVYYNLSYYSRYCGLAVRAVVH